MTAFFAGAMLVAALTGAAWIALRQAGALCRWGWIEHVWHKGPVEIGPDGDEVIRSRCVLCGRCRVARLPWNFRGKAEIVPFPGRTAR